ncbi:hypothetical protein AB0I28_13535 [Phytomonospora sp. NPDC050363]|uniref:hypothetical protein n=1 Tax=Phytomonospora sp. NPDC050363 TaxID=3155642 RepID=UPI0033C6D81B
MPTTDGAPNPSADPHLYPGTPVPGDCLLAGTWSYPLHSDTGGSRILDLDGGPLARRGSMPLDHALAELGVAPMSARRPVAAIGSNASAGQLRHKWSGAVDAIPMTRATATGINVGHSAHVARAGYLPYAPRHAEGRRTEVFVLWLDEPQIALLDASEPNYRHVTVSGRDYPLRLADGGHLDRWGIYRSRWGTLGLTAGGQAAALERIAGWGLADRLPGWPDVDAVQAALAEDERLRVALREALAAFALPDGLRESKPGPA